MGTILISLGKIYYDPKHAAVFGSVAKLVMAGKIIKKVVEEWEMDFADLSSPQNTTIRTNTS